MLGILVMQKINIPEQRDPNLFLTTVIEKKSNIINGRTDTSFPKTISFVET
jgi:hypothetical protein